MGYRVIISLTRLAPGAHRYGKKEFRLMRFLWLFFPSAMLLQFREILHTAN